MAATYHPYKIALTDRQNKKLQKASDEKSSNQKKSAAEATSF